MGYISMIYAILLAFLLGSQEISCKNGYTEKPSEASRTEPNPLATLIPDKNEIENVNNSNKLADEVLSRVKRRYDPYYYYRRYPPIPIFGGGFGIGPWNGFGGRGFGGRGYGGRGYGGRGFGGRGFGGGGMGGHAMGGRGGGVGGGHGGRG